MLCLLLALGGSACAAQAPIERRGQSDAAASWPTLAFDATIVDAHDVPVTTATLQQLEVTLDGKPAQGVTLRPAGADPQSICLLVDMSGSTYDDRLVIQRSLARFIRDLPAQDEVCLIDFSVASYVDAELSTERSRTLAALRYLKSSGGSAIADAVDAAVKYLDQRARFESRIIILLSDGDDNASSKSRGELFGTLRAPGAPVVYAVENEDKNRTEPRSRQGRDLLASLAEETGGLVYFARGDADVDATATNLIQALSQRYRLTLATGLPRDGSRHKLSAGLSKDARKQKWKANARRSFDAPLP